MEKLDTLHLIKVEQLNYKYYIQSLMKEASYCNLLSDRDINKIQSDLLVILAEQSDKWNCGESSSIPIEKAQDIITSILFVISIKLKSYQSPEQAVEKLKLEPLILLFESGLQIIRRKIAIAKHLQKQIVDNLFETPNVYYRSTVVDGINGFFKMYTPQFSAHEIHITADYPVFIGRPELAGIEFILQYLNCIEAENAFCIQFDQQDIHHLLCGITQDYSSVPINIFEPILLSAIGLTIVNKNLEHIDLTEADINILYRQFENKTKADIKCLVQEAISTINIKMNLPKNTVRYIDMCVPKIVGIIQNAVEMKTLDKVFIIPAYPEQDTKIMYSYTEHMDDIKYQKLVEKILQVDSGEERIELILNEVHYIADLLDILTDTELPKEDFEQLVNLMPITAFVALLAQYPCDDFLDRESEKLLFKALQKRKLSLSVDENCQIEKALKAFTKEDSFGL